MSEKFTKQFRPIKIDMHGVRLPEFKVEENKTNAIKEASDDYDLTEGEIQEIFSIDEFKEYYNIEELWGDAKTTQITSNY